MSFFQTLPFHNSREVTINSRVIGDQVSTESKGLCCRGSAQDTWQEINLARHFFLISVWLDSSVEAEVARTDNARKYVPFPNSEQERRYR